MGLFGYDSWDDYNENGIIPNIWKGFLGLKDTERNTKTALTANHNDLITELNWQANQADIERAFQDDQFKNQMDFANRQLAQNTSIANQNLQLQKDAFNYQRELNTTQMEREDSAMRRQMQDLQAAGLSPLAAVGSSGAGSAALSSGSAPQMDMSGINAASGQYLDIARQYAALHMQSSQDYRRGHSDAVMKHNSDVLGARMALNQMKSDMYYKGLNFATQAFNSHVNNEYIREQTDYLKDKHDWEDINGYRNTTWQSAIITALEKVADKYDLSKKAEEKVNSIISEFKSTLKDTSVSATESLVQLVQDIEKAEEIKDNSKKLIIAAIMKYGVLPSVEQIRKNNGK